jgi:hypothetical protein
LAAGRAAPPSQLGYEHETVGATNVTQRRPMLCAVDKTRQDQTRQDQTRQDKTRQDKTRQDTRHIDQNQNQIYSLEQYTVIPTATYSFVPPGCRRGRLAAAFPRPYVSGRLAPASASAVWPWSLPPVCSLPRVCYLSIAILSRLHTILGALTLRRRPAVTPSSARTSLEQQTHRFRPCCS